MSGFIPRLKWAVREIDEMRWEHKMTGGYAFAEHCVKEEMRWEGSFQGTQPNDVGVWLIVRLSDVRWYARMAIFVLTGRYPYGEEVEAPRV